MRIEEDDEEGEYSQLGPRLHTPESRWAVLDLEQRSEIISYSSLKKTIFLFQEYPTSIGAKNIYFLIILK